MAILVVDDSRFQRESLKKMLYGQGCSGVLLAKSGADALNLALAVERVDLVLLDIEMEEMNGIETCRRLKSEPRLMDVPVIMITTKGDVDTLNKAFEAGAHDFIRKPPNPMELGARVRSALALKREMDESKRQQLELSTLNRKLAAANEMLTRLAVLDGLTGIANRRYFDQVLEQEWARCARAHRPLGLIMADIDFFKGYNDAYGHISGDACLVKVARLFERLALRSSDLAARYGGEEFAVILPETPLEGVVAIAERLRAGVADLALPHRASDVADHVTVSLGAASLAPTPTGNPGDLVRAADLCLYRAKQAGRDQVVA